MTELSKFLNAYNHELSIASTPEGIAQIQEGIEIGINLQSITGSTNPLSDEVMRLQLLHEDIWTRGTQGGGACSNDAYGRVAGWNAARIQRLNKMIAKNSET